MTRPRLRPGLVVALLWLVGGTLVPAQAATTPPQAGATQAKPTAAPDLGRAYQYNTSSWFFAPASDAYRDLANADPQAVGAVATISARTFEAFNLAAVRRLPEAQAALDRAQQAFDQAQASLAPEDERLLRVNLLIGRSVIAGNRAAQNSGDSRNAGFIEAVNYGAAAASLAATPLRNATRSTDQAATQTDEGVALDPATALAYSQARNRSVPGAVVSRPMTLQEKLAELEARGDYAAAAAQLAMGDPAQATINNANARLALGRVGGDFAAWLRALVEDQAADLQIRAGDLAGAERTIDGALVIVQRSHGLSRPEAYLWRRKAELQSRLGELPGARASQERSFAILLDQTDGAQPTRGEVSPYLALLAPPAVGGDPASIARFFEVSSVATETSTAATIADVATRLATGDSASAVAIRNLQAARARLDRATARLTRVNAPGAGATPAQMQGAEADQHDARLAVAEAVANAERIAGPKSGAVVSPRTDLKAVQAVLRPDEAYVRFMFLNDGGGYAILVQKTGARVVNLAITEDQAAREVAELRFSTQVTSQGAVPGFRLSRSAALYRELFGELEPQLGDVRRLVIEPAGPLFSLPFGALLTRPADPDLTSRFIASRGADYRGAPWLARAVTLELSAGSAAFVRLRQVKPSQAPNPVLAFADPSPSPDNVQAAHQLGVQRESRGAAFIPAADTSTACIAEAGGILGFEPLPDSLKEAEDAVHAFGSDPAVALLAGDRFTDEAVMARKDLRSYRVLLFATHAALPNQSRCWPDPFLITTKGPDSASDGVLETTEIGALNLDADLVVLSACDTAAADANGQALGGLAQSFFFAGSRGVVVSHWAVNSKATAVLITGMLAANAHGLASTEALSQAERQLMDDPKLSHPYYWAAFTLIGGTGR